MNTLYLLGGPPRTAKTTIMSGLIAERNVQFIAADAIEHGFRNVLTGEPHQMLRDIEINGSAEHKASFTRGGERKPFSVKGTESELLLQAVIGMLDYYRRNKESVAFEGAAFVGYTNPSHADSIFAYAKDNPHDWINDWLSKDGGNETNIREMVAKQAVQCQELKSRAEQYGYPFFDISAMPFEEYIASAQRHLLES